MPTPRASLQVGVSLEAFVEEAPQARSLGQGQSLVLEGGLHVTVESHPDVVGIVLYVAQDLPDRLPLHDGLDAPAAVVSDGHVDGVGVAEEVVEIAQRLLVGARQEDPQVVGRLIAVL